MQKIKLHFSRKKIREFPMSGSSIVNFLREMTSDVEGGGGHRKWWCSRYPGTFNSTVKWIKGAGLQKVAKITGRYMYMVP